jgi:hypothetical protein
MPRSRQLIPRRTIVDDRTVRAVAEIISSGTGHILLGVGKSVLWVSAITVPVFLLMPYASASLDGWPLTGAAIFLIHGSTGCAVSLQQVVEGLRGTGGFPATERWLLLLAILAGRLLSTLQRGSFGRHLRGVQNLSSQGRSSISQAQALRGW